MGKHLILVGKRKCYHCKKIYPLNSAYFFNNKGKPNGLAQICKPCHSEDVVKRRHRPEYRGKNIYYQLKHKSIKRGIKNNISLDEFIEWYNKQKKACVYCGISEKRMQIINWGYLKTRKFVQLGIDRVDSNIGYEINNICLCCSICNAIKGSILSGKEMTEIGQKYIKPKYFST